MNGAEYCASREQAQFGPAAPFHPNRHIHRAIAPVRHICHQRRNIPHQDLSGREHIRVVHMQAQRHHIRLSLIRAAAMSVIDNWQVGNMNIMGMNALNHLTQNVRGIKPIQLIKRPVHTGNAVDEMLRHLNP